MKLQIVLKEDNIMNVKIMNLYGHILNKFKITETGIFLIKGSMASYSYTYNIYTDDLSGYWLHADNNIINHSLKKATYFEMKNIGRAILMAKIHKDKDFENEIINNIDTVRFKNIQCDVDGSIKKALDFFIEGKFVSYVDEWYKLTSITNDLTGLKEIVKLVTTDEDYVNVGFFKEVFKEEYQYFFPYLKNKLINDKSLRDHLHGICLLSHCQTYLSIKETRGGDLKIFFELSEDDDKKPIIDLMYKPGLGLEIALDNPYIVFYILCYLLVCDGQHNAYYHISALCSGSLDYLLGEAKKDDAVKLSKYYKKIMFYSYLNSHYDKITEVFSSHDYLTYKQYMIERKTMGIEEDFHTDVNPTPTADVVQPPTIDNQENIIPEPCNDVVIESSFENAVTLAYNQLMLTIKDFINNPNKSATFTYINAGNYYIVDRLVNKTVGECFLVRHMVDIPFKNGYDLLVSRIFHGSDIKTLHEFLGDIIVRTRSWGDNSILSKLG